MKGQQTLFQEEQYEYWEWKGKQQPDSIHTPKLIIVHESASHVYWTCPTCKNEINGEPDPERCDWCGQLFLYDWDAIDEQPYYIEMCKKRDAVLARERSMTYDRNKKELKKQLIAGEITHDEHKVHMKILGAETVHDYKTVERLRIELAQLKINQAEKEKRKLEYEIAKMTAS